MRIYKYLISLLILWLFVITTNAQNENEYIEYDKNFIFKEGVYLTFDEFKNNSPSIPNYRIARNSKFSGQIFLEYICYDSIAKTQGICVVQKCWGYVNNNSVYIYQGIGGSFYRLHIIGAFIHYFGSYYYKNNFARYDNYGYPIYYDGKTIENREYLLDFKTGEKFEFTYKNFSEFLKANDVELYNELENIKKKRKMIYHFLIKYNEKYPIKFKKT